MALFTLNSYLGNNEIFVLWADGNAVSEGRIGRNTHQKVWLPANPHQSDLFCEF